METNKDFFRHPTTGEIYPVEMPWAAEIVGSAGPLREAELWPLGEYIYTSDKLILI
ncbi:MAG TPA: hypothetical protein VMW16_11320 [Sedimentisphaerales bacterium]|nr:hypothetical protein [Sedimentisphaerales bacterium]